MIRLAAAAAAVLIPAAAFAQSETDARTLAMIEALEDIGCALPPDDADGFVMQTDFTKDEVDFVLGELEREGILVRDGRLGVASVNTVRCGGDVVLPMVAMPEESAEIGRGDGTGADVDDNPAAGAQD